MFKKLILTAIIIMSVFYITACGDDKEEQTPAPVIADNKAASESAVDTDAASGDAVTGEAVDPIETEEPEPTEDPGVVYNPDEINELLNYCIGIEGTAGHSLKYAVAADALLSYAIKNDLGGQNDKSIDNFEAAFKVAYDKLKKSQKKELKTNMTEDIMPMISDSFEDPEAYIDDFDDAGVKKSMKKNLKAERAKESWSVIWQAYEEARK